MELIGGYYTLRKQKAYISVKRYGHEERTKSHYHDFFEFVFVDRGFSMHRVGEETSLLLPGDIFYIRPGVSHEYWKSVNNCVYNCLFYPELFGEDLIELKKLPLLDKVFGENTPEYWNKMHLKPYDKLSIIGLLKKLEYETGEKPQGWEIRSKALLTDFMVSLSRVWCSCEAASADIKSGPAGTALGVVEIIEASVKNRMSVDDMARAAGYSPEYFSRTFRKLTGLSPSAYLISMRIAAAAEMLLSSDLPVSRIAEAAGFEDVNYFSRLFKKETGKKPSEFRSMSKLRGVIV